MGSSRLSPEARHLLKLWAKRGYTIYLRIYHLDDGYWWALQVEGGPRVITERSQNLTEVVMAVDPQLDRKGPKTKLPIGGWMAPEKNKGKK